MIDANGLSFRPLAVSDRDSLQHLLVRCVDYFTLVQGEGAPADEADSFLSEVPAGSDPGDKNVFGLFRDSRLVGVLDLIRDYPAPHEWWLGTLLLDPEVRGAGFGQSTYQRAETWLRENGALAVWLCVQAQNTRAERFWIAGGFCEVRRERMTLKQLESSIIVMRRTLLSAR